MRANSTTLVELMANSARDAKEKRRKKMRQEEEKKIKEIFKRSNKIKRTPPKVGEENKESREKMEETK